MGIFAVLLFLAQDEAQTSDGGIEAVFMDVGAPSRGIGVAAEVAEDDLGLGFEEVTPFNVPFSSRVFCALIRT